MENKKTRAPSSVNPAECMGSFRELTPVSSDDEDRIPSPPFEILGVDAAAAAAPAAAPAANPRRSDRIRERSVSRASSRNPSRDVSPEPSVDTNRAASMEPVGRRPRHDSSAASSRGSSPQLVGRRITRSASRASSEEPNGGGSAASSRAGSPISVVRRRSNRSVSRASSEEPKGGDSAASSRTGSPQPEARVGRRHRSSPTASKRAKSVDLVSSDDEKGERIVLDSDGEVVQTKALESSNKAHKSGKKAHKSNKKTARKNTEKEEKGDAEAGEDADAEVEQDADDENEGETSKNKKRAGTPVPTRKTKVYSKAPLGEAPLKPEMKGYSPNPFAELTCSKGHTVFTGHFAQAKYQDHCFICGVNQPGQNGMYVAFHCGTCGKKGGGRPFACTQCAGMNGNASGFSALVRQKKNLYEDKIEKLDDGKEKEDAKKSLKYLQDTIHNLGSGKDMRNLSVELLEKNVENEEGTDRYLIAHDILQCAHEFVNDKVYIGTLETEISELTKRSEEIKQELKKKKAELVDRAKRMEVQNKYDLWQSSVNSKMYPVPAILEKEKMIRAQRREEENAQFALKTKVKGMLFQKEITALEDAEPMEIDLDESVKQQQARAAENAHNKSNLSLAGEIKRIASTFIMELKENRELSGESKKQNEDVLKQSITAFLKINSKDKKFKKLSTALFESEEKIEDLEVGQKNSKKMKTIYAIHDHISTIFKKIKSGEYEDEEAMDDEDANDDGPTKQKKIEELRQFFLNFSENGSLKRRRDDDEVESDGEDLAPAKKRHADDKKKKKSVSYESDADDVQQNKRSKAEEQPKREAKKASKAGKKAALADTSDDESEVEKPKKKRSGGKRGSKKTVSVTVDTSEDDSEVESDDEQPKKRRGGKKPASLDTSDDESEVEKPKKKRSGGKRGDKKPASADTSDDESEVEKPKKKRSGGKRGSKKPVSVDTSEDDSEVESDDEQPKKRRGGKKPDSASEYVLGAESEVEKPRKRKRGDKKPASADTSDDESEVKKPKKKRSGGKRGDKKPASANTSDDESEVENSKKKMPRGVPLGSGTWKPTYVDQVDEFSDDDLPTARTHRK